MTSGEFELLKNIICLLDEITYQIQFEDDSERVRIGNKVSDCFRHLEQLKQKDTMDLDK